MKKKAVIDSAKCVGCGCCVKVCPLGAVSVPLGIHAVIDPLKCVGAAAVQRSVRHLLLKSYGRRWLHIRKKWYDYLWIVSLTYLVLGFFNILFAWLGLLCFFIPLILAVAGGKKG